MAGRTELWRARWAAIGAAVAVALGAGGIGLVGASVSSGSKPVFVPITPCRLLDTRAESHVGPRKVPLAAGSTYTATVIGSNGECTIPVDAVGININTTVLNGTADGYLTVFPADVEVPRASNLNWEANQPPTPNLVSVKLSADGKISFFSNAGTVDVIGDIVGYYVDHKHGSLGEISLPAQALNRRSDSVVISLNDHGLRWKNNYTDSAHLAIHRPADWTGTGNVTLTLLVVRSSASAGSVRFFARPRDYDSGDSFLDTLGITSNTLTNADTSFQEAVITMPAAELTKAWWEIVIQRDSSLPDAYTGDVTVVQVRLTYDTE